MVSRLLNKIPGLVHGYSTRESGDMRQEKNRELLVKNLILPDQVHGNIVQMASKKTSGADGLVSNQKSVFVGVLVADCVPLLLVDPIKKIVAAVHAGWKGTLGNIASGAVKMMGSNPQDIIVSIGPHIGQCCYTVPKVRAESFSAECVYFDGTDWHLDLGVANRLQLMEAGIPAENIDAPVVCTSCQSDIFYSYRKDSKESFGEMLAFIGYED